MKKAIKILLVYFVYLLLTICFGTVFYMAFLGVVNATAGHKVVFWNQELFIKTFFFIAVCSLSLICPFLISYRIRHRSGFLQTIVYIIVCVINWGILFPIAITQADKAGYEEISVENPDEEISIPVQENVIQKSPIDNFNRALDRTAFADLAFDNPTPTESFEPEETFADDENQDGLGFDIF